MLPCLVAASQTRQRCCVCGVEKQGGLKRALLQVYNAEAAPVEQLFRDAGLLLDFEITGGIPETLPRLVDALRPHSAHLEEKQAA